jgi:endonuclease G
LIVLKRWVWLVLLLVGHTAVADERMVVRLPIGFAGCAAFFPGGQAPRIATQPKWRELCYDDFAVLHNGNTRTPVFVVQRLNARTLAQNSVPRSNQFFADARLPESERASLDDYKHSGYSRGHMAPAGDMRTVEGMAQSFSLANMVPQLAEHNGGPWARIEEDTRKYVMRAKGDVFVFTGPVYGAAPATIGANAVRVPDHLFKLVFDATNGRAWVHWQDHAPGQRVGRPISYDEFVRRTGVAWLPPTQAAQGAGDSLTALR